VIEDLIDNVIQDLDQDDYYFQLRKLQYILEKQTKILDAKLYDTTLYDI